jgi:NAD-dependent deacetylase
MSSPAANNASSPADNSFKERIARLHALVLASQSVVFFGGAGSSTESGIPDFRSQDGLYSQRYAYPPEQILSHTFYELRPEVLFDFHREKVMGPTLSATPNAAHRALAYLEKTGHLSAVITQNIDGLHQTAGSLTVHELHGSIHRNYCQSCGAFYDAAQMVERVTAERVPHCTRPGCSGRIKPDVVLYEEALDQEVLSAAIEAIRSAEVLIVGGTSLAVNPAAGLVRLFQGSSLIIINKSETWNDSSADLIFREPISEVLGTFLPAS